MLHPHTLLLVLLELLEFSVPILRSVYSNSIGITWFMAGRKCRKLLSTAQLLRQLSSLSSSTRQHGNCASRTSTREHPFCALVGGKVGRRGRRRPPLNCEHSLLFKLLPLQDLGFLKLVEWCCRSAVDLDMC